MQKKSYTMGGFTLIELLVVVLIIGILAAIALPQYQYAVEKSRVAGALQTVSDLQKAVDIWLLERGGYPSEYTELIGSASTENLDIDITKSMDCSLSSGSECATSDFVFGADCLPWGCTVWAARRINNETDYYLSILKDSLDGTWVGDECGWYDTYPLGERICNELVAQGKMASSCGNC